jgi:hypothetical protein
MYKKTTSNNKFYKYTSLVLLVSSMLMFSYLTVIKDPLRYDPKQYPDGFEGINMLIKDISDGFVDVRESFQRMSDTFDEIGMPVGDDVKDSIKFMEENEIVIEERYKELKELEPLLKSIGK